MRRCVPGSLLILALPAHAGDFEANGRLESNLHFGLSECDPATLQDCRFLDFQDLVVVGGTATGAIGEATTWHLDGALRLHPVSSAETVEQTQFGNQVQPLSLDVLDAFVEIQELIGSAVDLRVGLQRFRWGTGLGVNPTNIVSPYDLRDPTDFDNRLGNAAISLRAHHEQTRFELVYTPIFRPARMPREVDLLEDADTLFDFSDAGGADVDVENFETRTVFPDARVGFAGLGTRLAFAAPAFDVSFMGYVGYDSLSQADGEARITGFATDGNRVDIGIPLAYPRIAVTGGDLFVPLPGDIGAWVEGTVVFPERTTVTAARGQLESLVSLGTLDEIPDPLPETVIQDGRPYPRLVVGLDRQFGRLRLAGQWVHGLPTERTVEDIGDYAMLVGSVSIGEIARFDASVLSDFGGVLASAEFSVLHRDAATIALGTLIARGPSQTTIGDLQGLSNITARVEVAF